MNAENKFPGVNTLRKVLQENNNQLKVMHTSEIWIASFTWFDPATLKRIRDIEKRLEKELPEDYKYFLNSISNGATLYYDEDFCQWGYKLYGVDEIIEAQIEWSSLFRENWTPNLLALGKIIGEMHPLIMDFNKPTKAKGSFEMLDGNPLDVPEYWDKMSISFYQWIENLITAQGAKYWLWK